MPAKKKLQKDSEQASDEDLSQSEESKSKKRPQRRKPVGSDMVRKSDLDQAEIPAPDIEHRRLHDIRPKNANADASFLAPENTSFGLREARGHSGAHTWLRIVAYFLGTIIVLIAIVFIGLSYYSQKLLNEAPSLIDSQLIITSPENAGRSAGNRAGNAVEQKIFKLTIVNAQGNIYDHVARNVAEHFKKEISLSAGTAAFPASERDVLYYKKSAQGMSAKFLDFLSELGITPVIQENSSQGADLVLYISSSPKASGLAGYTSSVYNGSGKGGEAKRYCGILSENKVDSCLALNSPSPEKGIKIFYRDKKIIAAAARIKEFQNAVFIKAQSSQTEDLKVVLGK